MQCRQLQQQQQQQQQYSHWLSTSFRTPLRPPVVTAEPAPSANAMYSTPQPGTQQTFTTVVLPTHGCPPSPFPAKPDVRVRPKQPPVGPRDDRSQFHDSRTAQHSQRQRQRRNIQGAYPHLKAPSTSVRQAYSETRTSQRSAATSTFWTTKPRSTPLIVSTTHDTTCTRTHL